MEDTNKSKFNGRYFRDLVKNRNFLKPVLGILIGGIGGYLYYHYIGCVSGTCPITSSPYGSVMMGSLLGFVIQK